MRNFFLAEILEKWFCLYLLIPNFNHVTLSFCKALPKIISDSALKKNGYWQVIRCCCPWGRLSLLQNKPSPTEIPRFIRCLSSVYLIPQYFYNLSALLVVRCEGAKWITWLLILVSLSPVCFLCTSASIPAYAFSYCTHGLWAHHIAPRISISLIKCSH